MIVGGLLRKARELVDVGGADRRYFAACEDRFSNILSITF
jgi:hypothetical protein